MDRCRGDGRAGCGRIVAMMTLTLNLWLAAKLRRHRDGYTVHGPT
jgi:hypothetical protein